MTKQFPKLPDDKRLSGRDAAGVLDLVWGRVDEEVEAAEEVQLPEEIPAWAGLEGYMAEWDGWTVSLVRECISAIASAAEEDEEELIEGAIERSRLDIINAKAAAERVQQDLARMSRERLLPKEKTLEKGARYETHLSRGGSTKQCTSSRPCRRDGPAAPLPWPVWTWMDLQGAKAKTFNQPRVEEVFSEIDRNPHAALSPFSGSPPYTSPRSVRKKEVTECTPGR